MKTKIEQLNNKKGYQTYFICRLVRKNAIYLGILLTLLKNVIYSNQFMVASNLIG